MGFPITPELSTNCQLYNFNSPKSGNTTALLETGHTHSPFRQAPFTVAPNFSGEIAEEDNSDDETFAVVLIFKKPSLILLLQTIWVATGKATWYSAIHIVNTITVRFRVLRTIILLLHNRSRSPSPNLSSVSLSRLRNPLFLVISHATMDIWVTKPFLVNSYPRWCFFFHHVRGFGWFCYVWILANDDEFGIYRSISWFLLGVCAEFSLKYYCLIDYELFALFRDWVLWCFVWSLIMIVIIFLCYFSAHIGIRWFDNY